jgi:ferrous iron transport protein A
MIIKIKQYGDVTIRDYENAIYGTWRCSMESIIGNQSINRNLNKTEGLGGTMTNLTQASINTEYNIKDIKANDEELKNFLFTLGCYEGESITVISILADNYVISLKDARYSIDKDLAEAIMI